MSLLVTLAGKAYTALLVTVARLTARTKKGSSGVPFLVYNELMALPEPKWAVYYGTITLDDGTQQTFTAEEVAELYGVQDENYLSIALTAPLPFEPGKSELEYYHLKPLPDGQYFNAIERYNTENEVQWDEDFDARRGGKWAVRPQYEPIDDTL